MRDVQTVEATQQNAVIDQRIDQMRNRMAENRGQAKAAFDRTQHRGQAKSAFDRAR